MIRTITALLLCVCLVGSGCRREKPQTALPSNSPEPAVAPPKTDPDFPAWPSTWVDAYKRFQAYIEARKADWPESGLHFEPDGAIEYTLRTVETRTENLGLDIYRRGQLVLGLALHGGKKVDLGTESRRQLLTPGRYAAFIKSSGSLGFQTHFPIVRIEVLESSITTGNQRYTSGFKLRETSPPTEGEAFWPNEHMQLFYDFHIFPHHHPNEIHKANAKVQPAIDLRVNKAGVIEREKLLEPAVEQLLRWRIYYNGELVEKGSAAGVKGREPGRGVGSYTVWLGVEGPSGFMPVSNLVEYPLFPSDAGENVVVPEKSGEYWLPDFARCAYEQLEAIKAEAEVNADVTNAPASPAKAEKQAVQAKNQELFQLWQTWAFKLEHPNIFTIPFAP